jgi:hypothetical protein
VDRTSVSRRGEDGISRRTERSIETGRTAASNTVSPQTVHGLLLDPLVAGEASKVDAREVEDNLASRLERERVERVVGVLPGEREDDAWAGTGRFRIPLRHELVDFLDTRGPASAPV